MINFDNHNITGMSYDNHTIKKAYGCDGRLVFQIEPQYRWKDTNYWSCYGYDKCYVAVKQISEDGGKTWKNVVPTETGAGTVIFKNSYQCGYVGTPKLKIYDNFGNVAQLNYESTSSSTLTYDEYIDTFEQLPCYDCDSCAFHFEIGDCVTTIGSRYPVDKKISFMPCAESVDFGNGVTTFYKSNGDCDLCSGLTAVTLPPNITELNISFEGDVSLKNMTIPDKVRYIQNLTWSGCTGLDSLTFLSTTPPYLGEQELQVEHRYTFKDTNNCILYVPPESVEAYKADAGWSLYASRIRPIP